MKPKTHVLLVAALLPAVIALGCRTVGRHTLDFDPLALKAYETPGTGVIHGHAFVRTSGGQKRNAAGLNVYLMPLTPYTEERAKMMQRGEEPPPAVPRLAKYVKTVVAEIMGGYRFEGLPGGRYILYTKIDWAGRRSAGEVYVVVITVLANGETKHVVIT